jgi:hypothetical protein
MGNVEAWFLKRTITETLGIASGCAQHLANAVEKRRAGHPTEISRRLADIQDIRGDVYSARC